MAKSKSRWFSHDFNARRDIKILEMKADYGFEGYGWWWAILEIMCEATDYKLKRSGKFLSIELGLDSKQLDKFIDDCINEYGLFQADDKYFWSDSLLSRLGAYDAKCEINRQNIINRWAKEKGNTGD